MYQTPTWFLAETPEAAAAREAHNKKTSHQAARAALEFSQAASKPNAYIEILSAAGPFNVDMTIVVPNEEGPEKTTTRRLSRLTQIRRYAPAPHTAGAACGAKHQRFTSAGGMGAAGLVSHQLVASQTDSRVGHSKHALTRRIIPPSSRRSVIHQAGADELVNDVLAFVARKRVSAAALNRIHAPDPLRVLSLSL